MALDLCFKRSYILLILLPYRLVSLDWFIAPKSFNQNVVLIIFFCKVRKKGRGVEVMTMIPGIIEWTIKHVTIVMIYKYFNINCRDIPIVSD